MSFHIIRSVNFLEGGAVSVEYLTPELDVKDNGMVVNHGVLIPPTEEFVDDLDLLLRNCQRFLSDALRVFAGAESGMTTDPQDALPYGDEDENDDRPGPYDNPEER